MVDSQLLLTDKSRCTVTKGDSSGRVWKFCGECSAACNTLQHDQFSDGLKMVWGEISLEVHTDQDEILRNTPRP